MKRKIESLIQKKLQLYNKFKRKSLDLISYRENAFVWRKITAFMLISGFNVSV